MLDVWFSFIWICLSRQLHWVTSGCCVFAPVESIHFHISRKTLCAIEDLETKLATPDEVRKNTQRIKIKPGKKKLDNKTNSLSMCAPPPPPQSSLATK